MSTPLHDGDVVINGIVRSVRKQKKNAFVSIGDGSALDPLQVIMTPDQARDLSTGAAVSVRGEVKSCPPGTAQSHELHAGSVQLAGSHDGAAYPLQKKYHGVEFLRSLPHLRSRLPFNSLLLRLRSKAISASTAFFEAHGFVQTHPPIITSSDCEGGGEVFSLVTQSSGDEYFRTSKYLTVSSQLHLEAFAQSAGNVWALSPTFRAERSDTARHLSEFYMLEAEMAFVDSLEDVMQAVQGLIQNIVAAIQGTRIAPELLEALREKSRYNEEASITSQELETRWQGIARGPWPRITYEKAIGLLQDAVAQSKANFHFPPTLGVSLQSEHERYIAEKVGCGSPVFVINYPRDIKPFYMAPATSEAGSASGSQKLPLAACFDLLVPEVCEIAGGSLREHRLEPLLASMARHGLIESDGSRQSSASSSATKARQDGVPEGLQWYVDLRRFGSVPHGGAGLGFDRLLCYLSGVSSVRDVVPFPRWVGRCDC